MRPTSLLPDAFAVTSWPPWVVMWLLAVMIYVICKWLLWQQTKADLLSKRGKLAFFLAWPGMNPEEFAEPPSGKPQTREWVFAAAKFCFGLTLLYSAGRWGVDEFAAGWIGMIGVVFTLHFGLFHLLSCLWRRCGFTARPLMDWPIASQSLGEFWGQRWNLAFRDLTHRFLFQPLARRFGLRWGLWISFLISGLIHDAVITLPAGGGYGSPTLFFLLQAAGISLERSRTGRSLGLRHGWRGWIFTSLVLLLPVGLLFPPIFVFRVMVPFLQAMGASG